MLIIKRLIAWIGKCFMEGSGYKDDLHKELVLLRREVEYTNRLLRDVLGCL